MGTSLAAPSEVVATEEHHVVWGNVLPINPTSSLYNESHVQFGENRAPTHCNVLLSGMDGVHLEVNAHVLGVTSINPLPKLLKSKACAKIGGLMKKNSFSENFNWSIL